MRRSAVPAAAAVTGQASTCPRGIESVVVPTVCTPPSDVVAAALAVACRVGASGSVSIEVV